MMGRIWLGVILGVLLGGGAAYMGGVSVASPVKTNLPMNTFETQPRTGQTTRPVQSESQLILISLLAGIIVAGPVFLVAKKRT